MTKMKSSASFLAVTLLLVVTLLASFVHGQTAGVTVPQTQRKFGGAGHAECAMIASAYLSNKTMTALTSIIPELAAGGKLSDISSWADSVKTTPYPWSPRLHFINTAGFYDCTYNRTENCKDYKTMKMACLDGAIMNYTSQLITKQFNGINLTAVQMDEAAKFLVHYMGDIHQPLHVGFAGDSGGNGEFGTFEAANNVALHAVWDTNIIAKRDNDFGGQNGYTAWLTQQINASNPNAQYASNLASWLTCANPSAGGVCSDEWAQESLTLACTYAYKNTSDQWIVDGFNLQDPYYTRAYPQLDLELARCGYRLAYVLNNIFDNAPPPAPPARGLAYIGLSLNITAAQVTTAFLTTLFSEFSSTLGSGVAATRFSLVAVVDDSTTPGNSIVQLMVSDDPNTDTIAAVTIANDLIELINTPDSALYSQPNSKAAVAGSAALQFSPMVVGGSSSTGGAPGSGSTGPDAGNGDGGDGTDSAYSQKIIIGVVVAVAGVVIILLILWYCFCYKKTKHKEMEKRMKSGTDVASLQAEFGDLAVPAPKAQAYNPNTPRTMTNSKGVTIRLDAPAVQMGSPRAAQRPWDRV